MISQFIKKSCCGLIRLYQKTLSPDHGLNRIFFPYGYCRYYPSCSQYMNSAIQQHGLISGLWLGLKRLGRCTPWHAGGTDYVPPLIKKK